MATDGEFFHAKSVSATVGVAVAVLMIFLTAKLPLCWDEADTFARVDSVRAWGSRVGQSFSAHESLFSEFSATALREAFPNTITREGHPAGYVIVSALGKSLAQAVGVRSEKTAYRFGPILLFAVAMAVVHYRVTRIFGASAAWCAVVSILLLPHLFVHSQIAFGDSVLLSSWLLAWGTFARALGLKRRENGLQCFAGSRSSVGRTVGWWQNFLTRNREKTRAAVVFGACLGLTAAAKFSGLIAIVPFGLFVLIEGIRGNIDAVRRFFFVAFPTAVVFFYLLNPPIWHDPFEGVQTFFHLNTHRAAYNIAILFLGRTYNLDHPLPWWNTLFWTAVTVPPGLLFAALWGVVSRRGAVSGDTREDGEVPDKEARAQRWAVWLLVMNFAALITVRAFPGLPVHDGVRLFLAAFGFLGILAGVGLANLLASQHIFAKGVAVAIFLSAVAASVNYFPHGLSYYNALIGGAAGAKKSQMETTYYWDGLSAELLAWLNAQTEVLPDGGREGVLFSPASMDSLRRLADWGDLKADYSTVSLLAAQKRAGIPLENLPRFRWYVLQCRQGAYSDADRRLIAEKKPVASVILKRSGITPFLRCDTTLVNVYSYRDFLEAAANPLPATGTPSP